MLQIIRDNVRLYGYPPSVRELARDLGGVSTSNVAHRLRALADKGYIRRVDGQARAIEVIDQ